MMGGYGAVIAENYPSEARSTAENIILVQVVVYLVWPCYNWLFGNRWKLNRSNESCICYLSDSTYFYVVHCSRNKRYRNRLNKKGYAFA